MNYAIFLSFFVYALATLVIGIAIYVYLNPKGLEEMNRFVFLGEAYLLGSGPYLWRKFQRYAIIRKNSEDFSENFLKLLLCLGAKDVKE